MLKITNTYTRGIFTLLVLCTLTISLFSNNVWAERGDDADGIGGTISGPDVGASGSGKSGSGVSGSGSASVDFGGGGGKTSSYSGTSGQDPDKSTPGPGSTRGGDSNPGGGGGGGYNGTSGQDPDKSTPGPGSTRGGDSNPGGGGGGGYNGTSGQDPDKSTPGPGSTRGGDSNPGASSPASQARDSMDKAATAIGSFFGGLLSVAIQPFQGTVSSLVDATRTIMGVLGIPVTPPVTYTNLSEASKLAAQQQQKQEQDKIQARIDDAHKPNTQVTAPQNIREYVTAVNKGQKKGDELSLTPAHTRALIAAVQLGVNIDNIAVVAVLGLASKNAHIADITKTLADMQKDNKNAVNEAANKIGLGIPGCAGGGCTTDQKNAQALQGLAGVKTEVYNEDFTKSLNSLKDIVYTAAYTEYGQSRTEAEKTTNSTQSDSTKSTQPSYNNPSGVDQDYGNKDEDEQDKINSRIDDAFAVGKSNTISEDKLGKLGIVATPAIVEALKENNVTVTYMDTFVDDQGRVISIGDDGSGTRYNNDGTKTSLSESEVSIAYFGEDLSTPKTASIPNKPTEEVTNPYAYMFTYDKTTLEETFGKLTQDQRDKIGKNLETLNSVKTNNEEAKLAQELKDFLISRGAKPEEVAGVSKKFAEVLVAEIKKAELQTGVVQKNLINQLDRLENQQAQFYANHIGKNFTWNGVTYTPQAGKIGNPGAHPAQGRHVVGFAADLNAGKVRDAIRANADIKDTIDKKDSKLEVLANNYDIPHVQMNSKDYFSLGKKDTTIADALDNEDPEITTASTKNSTENQAQKDALTGIQSALDKANAKADAMSKDTQDNNSTDKTAKGKDTQDNNSTDKTAKGKDTQSNNPQNTERSLVDKVQDASKVVADTVKSVAKSVWGGIKDIFGIESREPSTVSNDRSNATTTTQQGSPSQGGPSKQGPTMSQSISVIFDETIDVGVLVSESGFIEDDIAQQAYTRIMTIEDVDYEIGILYTNGVAEYLTLSMSSVIAGTQHIVDFYDYEVNGTVDIQYVNDSFTTAQSVLDAGQQRYTLELKMITEYLDTHR